MPQVSTTSISSITSIGASTGGNVTTDGGASVTARGVAYGTSQNPTVSGTTTSNGTGTGTFTSTLTGLTPATAYNVRAYATNTVGTAYANQISFTTLFPASVLPTVTTDAATSITSTGATTGGHVTSDGGVAVFSRGVAYSTNQNPTTSNSTTINGSGIGTFTSQLQGLAPLTTYFGRAYATNSVGTSYGNQITWTTIAPSGIVVALGQATACSGNVITVPIAVQNFINIGAVSLDIEYDSTALTYIGFNSSGLSGNLIVNNPNLGGTPIGRVLVSWFSLTPSNLNNGLMMNLRFTANKTTPLIWNTSVAGQCELADANGDVIPDVVFANGRFTALNAQITAQPSPNISIASGLTATVSVSATGVSAYQWQINSGGGNWTNLSNGGGYSGVTTSTLGILASQNMDGSQYRVVLSSDSCNAVTSGVSTLSIISLVLPSITTTSATSVTTTSANTGGNVTSDGGASVTARGVAYASTQNPTLAGLFTSNGSGTGSFVSTISGLSPVTTYHVRAYATNSVGTEYGNQISFTTQSPQIQIPTLTTTAVTSISLSGAISGGNITSDGGAAVTSRGLAFGTAPNPTTSGTRTSNGSGTGVFTGTLTGLSSSTLYYIRAYATNSAGTAYGNQLTFTTLSPVPVLPSVTTDAATSITPTGATSGGNVTSDGGSAVSTRGVAYGLLTNPT
ncbi:MAG: beta strand repeat-containing protein, partial [Bacteroidota bacterium]